MKVKNIEFSGFEKLGVGCPKSLVFDQPQNVTKYTTPTDLVILYRNLPNFAGFFASKMTPKNLLDFPDCR